MIDSQTLKLELLGFIIAFCTHPHQPEIRDLKKKYNVICGWGGESVRVVWKGNNQY